MTVVQGPFSLQVLDHLILNIEQIHLYDRIGLASVLCPAVSEIDPQMFGFVSQRPVLFACQMPDGVLISDVHMQDFFGDVSGQPLNNLFS